MTLLAGSLVIFSPLGVRRDLLGPPPGAAPRRRRHVGCDGADDRGGDGRRSRSTRPGVGSAVLNSMRQVGGSLGIAIMGAIVAASVHRPAADPRALGRSSCRASTTR